MKTTLNLDDDVAVSLSRLYSSREATLDQVVNEALRCGLRKMEADEQRKSFQTHAVDLGSPLIANIDNVAEVLAIIEGEAHK